MSEPKSYLFDGSLQCTFNRQTVRLLELITSTVSISFVNCHVASVMSHLLINDLPESQRGLDIRWEILHSVVPLRILKLPVTESLEFVSGPVGERSAA